MSSDPSGKIAVPPKAFNLSKRDLLILAATLILCVCAMLYFFNQSAEIMGPVEMGVHGWIALGIGVFVSLAVGIGLMVLVFFSARNGFDDRVRSEDED